ncbi:MAG TPA: carbon storage regulator CsrA [Spirochaetota bacterium]|nr:carbon storage regulator CsrA [Spirochaetota bacterium]HOL57356.1 carbon storage regulator CsrA [Spirochaetota bacterium]HPP04944.1 carbon storage regulator CsrA [Spirochaetota bacterium]
MLILSRKENQSIMIGDNIEITIVSIKGDHVKIGINAPTDVKVFRKEIFEEIQNANKEAVNVDPNTIKDIGSLLKKKE